MQLDIDPSLRRYRHAKVADADDAERVDRGGYHQPQNAHFSARCGCELVTDKGAYRDESYRLDDGTLVHYYHQSPVVIEAPNGDVSVSPHGYRTTTTKERINRHTPRGYRVIQRDFEWYVETPDDGRIEFRDGMVLNRI